jgi:serine/threonine protein kinase
LGYVGEEQSVLSEPDEETPDRVVAGRYRLERVLGRGGMGTVWLAVDTLIERKVALKELRAPQGVTESDEDSFVERALREARNAGRLNHPGVVAVHDVIAPSGGDDAVYIVMEYVMAPSLMEIIDEQGSLPEGRVAAMGLGIVDALMAAHTMGIVHRDIKPGNVLVREGDRIKLTDFGIALAAEDTRLTRTGVIGTHAYLAPECFDTGQTGPAADLWALGATLFHAVAGRAPFDRPTTTETLRAILFEDAPPPPCEPGLAEVINGLLTRSVDDRMTSDVARQKLEPLAAEAAKPAKTEDRPTSGGQSWEAQATGVVHRPSPASPPAPTPAPPAQAWGQATQPAPPPSPYTTPGPVQPSGHTTQPGGPPSPYATSQPGYGAQPAPSYSGGGWGSGPQAPQPAGSWGGGAGTQERNNTPWIIGGVLAAGIVLILVIALAAGGGGGGGGSTSSPDGAVRGMLDAVINGDCSQAAEFVTENFTEACPENPEDVGLVTVDGVEVLSQDGGTALVSATVSNGSGSTEEIAFDVVQVDGEWRVDSINFNPTGDISS